MKKGLLLLLSAVIIGILIFIIFYFAMHFINYKSRVNYDADLSYQKNNIMNKFLTKLKYKVHNIIFQFDKNINKSKIVIVERPKSNNFKYDEDYYLKKIESYKSKLSKDQRIIVFLNNNFYNSDEDFFSYDTDQKNDFLFEVNKLYLNKNCNLFDNIGKIKPSNLSHILTVNDRLIIAIEEYNAGEIIYIADSFIFSDKSILKDDNAVLLNNILKKYHKDTIFIDKIYQQEIIAEQKNSSFLFMNHFPYLLLQAIIIFLVFILVHVKRFGPPVEFDKYKKRSIAYHLDAVGKFFEKSSSESGLIKIFDQYFIERLQKIVKYRSTDHKSFFLDLIKRYNIKDDEKIIFNINDFDNMSEIQSKRELFIKKIKSGDK